MPGPPKKKPPGAPSPTPPLPLCYVSTPSEGNAIVEPPQPLPMPYQTSNAPARRQPALAYDIIPPWIPQAPRYHLPLPPPSMADATPNKCSGKYQNMIFDVVVVDFKGNMMVVYLMKEDEMLCDVWPAKSVEFQGMKHNATFWQSKRAISTSTTCPTTGK